jgi:plasmid stability protein
MARITIRNLDDTLKQHLRMRAAQHGRSMEDAARDNLRVEPDSTVAAWISARPASSLFTTTVTPSRDPLRP